MIKFAYILLFFVLSKEVSGQFWKNNREEELQEEAVDDLGSLPTAEHFPYIEKFHKAVREKISGNLKEAKQLFKECLEAYPHDDAVYFALGEIAKEQKLKSEALDYYIKAHQRDTANIHYIQEIAYIQFDKAQFDKAVVNFKKLVEHEPRHPQWLYGYAQSLLFEKDYEEAIKIFNKFEDQIGPVPEVTMTKVELYEVIGKEDKIDEELLKLKQANPQNLDVLKNIIGYYEEKGNEEKAIELIKELVEREPNNGVAHFILSQNFIKNKEYDNFYTSALIVAKSEEVEVKDKILLFQPIFTENIISGNKILNITKNLIEVHPENARIIGLHAEILTEQGRTKEAASHFEKALQLEDSEYQLWVNTLAFFSAFKEYELLHKYGEKGTELFPSLPFMYYSAAEGSIYAGEIDEALDYLEMGLMYVIDDDEQLGKITLRKGQAQYLKNSFAEGDQSFEKAMSLLKDDGVTLHIAYLKATKDKELKNGLKVAEQIMNKRNLGARNYYEIGYILMKNNQLDRAEKFLTTAIKETTYSAEIHDLLGDVQLKREKTNEAIKSWKNAIESESRNKNIPKKIEDKKYYAPSYY